MLRHFILNSFKKSENIQVLDKEWKPGRLHILQDVEYRDCPIIRVSDDPTSTEKKLACNHKFAFP
jgi:hypothetical protein